jgi:polysaccharide biosynthesis transport protein
VRRSAGSDTLAPPEPPSTLAPGPNGAEVGAPDDTRFDADWRPADLLRLVIKHAFWVLLAAAVVPVLVGLWTARQPKVYEAQTTIVFDLSAANTLGKKVEGFDPYSNYLTNQELLETEFRVITSMRVAKQVIIDAGLDADPAFVAAALPGLPPERVTVDLLAESLRQRIKIEPVKGTRLAVVRFEDADAARAQRLVSTVVSTYIRLSNEDSGGATGAALAYLNEQFEKLKGQLDTSEMELHNFKLDRNLISVSLNDQSNMLREEIGALNQAVTASTIRRTQLLSRAAALARVSTQNPDDVPASEFLQNETLSLLRQRYQAARGECETFKGQGKLDHHPDVVACRSRLEDALQAFIAEVRNIQAAATRDAAVVASEVGGLSGLLESAKGRALDLNLHEINYNRLYRNAASNEKLYQNVLERMKEVDLSRMINVKNIKTLDAPILPGAPIRPKMSTNLLVGTLAGLFLGLVVAFLREAADRTIKTPADVESKLRITSLGLLPSSATGRQPKATPRRHGAPAEASTGPELLAHEQPTSSMAEAARSIRSNILFMSPDRPPRVILVTSSGPGEGKTTTATSLAVTFAQAGSRVLLVDLDLRRPRLHRIFRTGSDHGITTVLLGESIDDAVRPSPVPNLYVLAAGPLPPNPAELLMSERMHEIIGQLGEKFDRVVIDSAPVNPITDALILSTRVDGTIFVVRAFQTSIDQVRHAVRRLLDVKARLLGVVLNAVDFEKLEYRYYAYGYRAYGGYGQEGGGRDSAAPAPP